MDPTATVKKLKEQLEKDADISVQSQRLIFSGHVLKDESTLDSYVIIKDNSSIHLVRTLSSNGTNSGPLIDSTSTAPPPTQSLTSAGHSEMDDEMLDMNSTMMWGQAAALSDRQIEQ